MIIGGVLLVNELFVGLWDGVVVGCSPGYMVDSMESSGCHIAVVAASFNA